MSESGLTPAQIEAVRGILKTRRDKIQKVGVFGSRATGKYRDNSDLDLVLYGPLLEEDVRRLWTLFDESLLPFKVDVIAYDLIDAPLLKKHVDEVAVNYEAFQL